MAALVEDHHLILLRASAKLFSATLRESLYEHVELLPLIFLVLNGTDLRLEGDELIQAADLLLLRHIVGQMLRGIGARALRVLEHKGRVVAHLSHQVEAHLMILLRLVVVAHEDVCREPAVRNNPADSGHTVQIPLTGVLAVHQLQDLVATALHRQMDMLAHVRHLGNHSQCLVAHVLRVRCGEAHAHLRHFLCHATKKSREKNSILIPHSTFLIPHSSFHLPPIRIHVLSQ